MSDAMEERGRALENEYFRRQEQELVQKMKEKMAAEAAAVVATIKCPKCDGTLIEVPFESINIDICDKCGGAWLDAGELEQVTKEENKGLFSRLFK